MQFEGYNLKSKAYFIECEEHTERQESIRRYFEKKNTTFNNAFKLFGMEISPKSYLKDILEEISSQNFYGYASLFVMVQMECSCPIEDILTKLFKVFSNNEELRKITKIVATHNYINVVATKTHFEFTCLKGDEILKYPLLNSSKNKSLTYSKRNVKSEEPTGIPLRFKYKSEFVDENSNIFWANNINISLQVRQKFHKINHIQIPKIDNLVFIQFKNVANVENITLFAVFLERLFYSGKKSSIQEIGLKALSEGHEHMSHEFGIFATTCTEGCYVFNLNPALVLVFNHISFFKLRSREPSFHNLNSLRKWCISNKIPYLILKDGSAEDVQQIMHEVEQFDFSGLRNLYIIIMSHGQIGDIIETKTNTYNIHKNIVRPLIRNHTLDQVAKLVLVNACRGSGDPRKDCIPDKHTSTQMKFHITYHNSHDVMILYSARHGRISLLNKEKGAYFVQTFCEVLQDLTKSTSKKSPIKILQIVNETERRLRAQLNIFHPVVTEFCCRPDANQVFNMQCENLIELQRLYIEFHNRCSKAIQAKSYN